MSAAPCDEDRCVIAHHEAGHAVVTHALGGPIASVTIIPTTERLGCVWARMPTPEMTASTVDEDIATTVDLCARLRALLLLGKSRAPGAALIVDAIDRGIILLAGPMAEQKLIGAFDAGVARSDLVEAEAYAGAIAISPEAAWQYFCLFRVEARALVNQHWHAVTAVADALIHCQNLTGEEVNSIIVTATAQRDIADEKGRRVVSA